MKKLLVFAAVAAMGIGAYAGCGEDSPAEGQVYQVKMLLKTTQGRTVSEAGDACGEGGHCLILRVPDRIGLYGWMFGCARNCSFDGMTAVLWDPSRKAQLLDEDNPLAVTVDDDSGDPGWNFSFVNVLANDRAAETSWEILGSFDYGRKIGEPGQLEDGEPQYLDLVGSGFGTYGSGFGTYVAFSGFAAGLMSAPYDLRSKKPACCGLSVVKQCVAQPGLGLADEYVEADTALFGKWAFRLNPRASVAYQAAGTAALRKHSPKYVNVWSFAL